ncbi:MAG: hypothetical protein QOH42_2619 [Blastocatellia bacterium]|nr:hypothetical protein [Blastocatellia bacterium]
MQFWRGALMYARQPARARRASCPPYRETIDKMSAHATCACAAGNLAAPGKTMYTLILKSSF